MKCSEKSHYPFTGGQLYMFKQNEVKMASQIVRYKAIITGIKFCEESL